MGGIEWASLVLKGGEGVRGLDKVLNSRLANSSA